MSKPVITVHGHQYEPGQIVALPMASEVRRTKDGMRLHPETLFLVVYDLENDLTVLEPISWRLANVLCSDALFAELDRVRAGIGSGQTEASC